MSRQLGLGGTERQLTETAKALDRSRFEPHVGCFHAEGFRADELRCAGIPILRLPVTSFLSISAVGGARQMERYLEEHSIQVVHTWDMPLALYGVPVARFFRTARVLSSQRCYRALASPLERHLLRITDRMADGIVVNSNAVRADLIEHDRVPAGLIHLCHNGIDTRLFHPPENRCSDSITIGTICALRPEKGLETLIEAFAAMPARSHVKLAIVGNGEMRKPLEKLAVRMGLDGRCAFEPATADVAGRLHRMDIFVLPSLSEALSNSVMEAMACGCAVVASEVGGNPELVTAGENGLLFRAGDARGLANCLERLVTDSALRHRLGEAASQRMRTGFTLERAAARMGEIYETVLRGTAIR
jgi:glycosyltransferase involved in cell wall biosynthesis